MTQGVSFGRTQWFEPHQKPVRPGVYQRRSPEGGYCFYSYWNGEFWGLYEFTTKSAAKCKDHPSAFQQSEWRGLTKEAYQAIAPYA